MRRYIVVFIVICAFMMFFLSAAYSENRSVTVKGKKGTDTAVSTSAHYYALIIGNNNYKHLPKLKTPIADARAVENILKTQYGFKTKLLIDATRNEILTSINDFRKKLGQNDNFLIYYAGHGEFDKTADKSYWLPVDAQNDNPANWIIADDITSNIKRIESKHILLVADSCYSGTLTRAVSADLATKGDRDKFIKKMFERPSRTLMASGGNEPVTDSGGVGHSVFAAAFLKALREMDKSAFTAEELFHGRIKTIVAGKSDQVPEYNDIRNSGHEGGDFVFQLAKALVSGTGGDTPPLTPVEINKPSDSDFKIDDLEKEAKEIEKNKAAWNSKLKEMKQAYAKVKTFEKGTSPADRKASAWQRFLETFSQDNPYSQEDDSMRQYAEVRISHWNSKQEKQIAMAPAKKFFDKITGKEFKDPLTDIEMVLVKGGCFQMGDTFGDGESDEKPVHEACVDDFYIGKYEVTNAQYRQFKSNHDSKSYEGYSLNGDSQPVGYVSWEDATTYAEWLSNKTGKKYRLPTEAEWEYAARGGTNIRNYWGSSKDEACKYANVADQTAKSKWSDWTTTHNCDDGYAVTSPVGKFQPNTLGLYDMMGNVWEWTNDWYDKDYYNNSPKNNPQGPNSGQYRVLRGGFWNSTPQDVRASNRFRFYPTDWDNIFGFRLVVSAK